MERRWIELARTLARRRAVRAGATALALLGFATGSLPLVETPGYELAEAAALVAVVLAPLVGIAAARAERARSASSPWSAWVAGSAVLVGLLALLCAAAIARAALGRCSPVTAGTWFVPLLVVPSALLGTAVAVAAGFASSGRRGLAVALYAVAVLASVAASLRAAYAHAAAFVFDPLLGAWPGPLYDEALAVDLRVVLLRGAAAAWALGIAAAAEAAVRIRRAGARTVAAPALAALVASGAALGARAALDALRLSGTRDAVARALGGRREGRRCTLVHPVEKPPAWADALLADCEFQVADVARRLGIERPPHVTAFLYRDPAEKRRLVGAAGTEYAKPWLGEIHLVDAPLPHPVLRHEVVHAVAAGAASGPLRVPARAGVLVSAGLVEGLAAALETPRSRWTVHEWSRAARDLGLLPDVRRIVGPAGFWSEPPARAYTAAGSFLRFLLERHGADQIRAAYRSGDLAAALGAPLDTLVAEWDRFLDGVAVPEGLGIAARARLAAGSLFARRCAREVATIEAQAREAAAAGRAGSACALYDRAAALSGSAADLEAVAAVRARSGDLDRAEAGYRAAARAADSRDVALLMSIAASQGDIAWRRGDLAAATAAWTMALDTRPDRAEARLLAAKLVAAAAPALATAARDFLLGDGDPAVALARVARADHPLAAYLVGRQLAGRGEAAAAVPELARAAAGRLPPLLDGEARLLLGAARCAAGDRAGGEATLGALREGASDADRERIDEALRRCEFTGR